MATTVRRALFYLILLMTWEAIFRLRLWPEFLFPSPLQVLQALIDGLSETLYLDGVVASLRRIIVGYGVSVLVGTLLGLMQARWRLLDETPGSLVLGLQTLPSICWLPLALLWFGLNERAIIFVVIMGSLLSITIATEHGVKHTPPLLIRAAQTMGARDLKMCVDVILPAALPSVIEI